MSERAAPSLHAPEHDRWQHPMKSCCMPHRGSDATLDSVGVTRPIAHCFSRRFISQPVLNIIPSTTLSSIARLSYGVARKVKDGPHPHREAFSGLMTRSQANK